MEILPQRWSALRGEEFVQGRPKDKLGRSAVGWQDSLVHRDSVFVVIGQTSLGLSVCCECSSLSGDLRVPPSQSHLGDGD